MNLYNKVMISRLKSRLVSATFPYYHLCLLLDSIDLCALFV